MSTTRNKRNPPDFGTDMRNEEFTLQPGIVFLNQGTIGNMARRVAVETKRIEDEHELDYDKWFSLDQIALTNEAKETVGSFLGADPANLAFEENTTRGINNVMKSISWQSGDAILYNNWTYSSMKSIIQELVDGHDGLIKIELQYPYPIESEEQILQLYEETLSENENITFVLLDEISSRPSVRFPVKPLVELCHQYGAMVLVDGAHVPGHIPVNIEDIGADFYVGNLHKWCFSSRGCGFVHSTPHHHGLVRPVVTTFFYGLQFPINHINQATRNSTPFISAPSAIEFIQWIGGHEAIHAYCTPMLEATVQNIVQEFNTTKLQVPESMECPLMRCVEIPMVEGLEGRMDIYFREKYDILVSLFEMMDSLYLRICGSIFNTDEDYRKLEESVKDLVENGPDPDVLFKINKTFPHVRGI